jgi:Prolyl oligopeptidase family
MKKRLSKLYARWMYRWEHDLTTRDSNRVVRPVEWGFDWLQEFARSHGFSFSPYSAGDTLSQEKAMLQWNDFILQHREAFFAYQTPRDFVLEVRHPQLFPTNVRPKTLRQDARIRRHAAEGKLAKAEFLRFTSPAGSPYPENDRVNARWFPASPERMAGKPKQAIIVMPHWNADALSHNALCSVFARFGISALRLSKPYHDIRRPAELARADYAVSSNIGRTIAACRQAVIDIRCCLDWLEQQGYEQFGILGTSLGSCYAFLAAAMDSRLRVAAFNHASMSFGDVVWTGQSTRHIREAFEQIGMTHQRLRAVWAAISPYQYMDQFALHTRKTLLVHATYDLTFLREYSLQVIENFRRRGIDFVSRVLPCGHYTTGETPYKFMDGWYLGSFIYSAFKEISTIPMSTPAGSISR